MAIKHKSRIARVVHEAAADAHRAGVMDKTTMREFDALCLSEVEVLSPEQIQVLRERERVSQAVLARYLNVTTGLISQWERGERRPSGPALALLGLIQRKGLAVLVD